MPGVLQLIERTMIDRLSSTSAPPSGLESMKQFLCVLSVSFLAMALVFLVYGTHTWLSIHYSKDMAAIIIGTISLALSITIGSILLAFIYYQKMRIRKFQERIVDKIKSSLSALEDELGDPIRENPKTALIIASLIGFLAEDQIFE